MKTLLRSLLLFINTAIFWLSDITVTQAPPISMTSVHGQSCETSTSHPYGFTSFCVVSNVLEDSSASEVISTFNRTKSTNHEEEKLLLFHISLHSPPTHDSPLFRHLTCTFDSVVVHGTKMFILIYLIFCFCFFKELVLC